MARKKLHYNVKESESGKWAWLQVGLSEREVEMITELTESYGFRDRTQFFRLILSDVARKKPILNIYPDRSVSERDGKRGFFQMKMATIEERQEITELAKSYGLTDSDFIRLFVRYIYQVRPHITIEPGADEQHTMDPAPLPTESAIQIT